MSVLFRKLSPIPKQLKVCPTFSSTRFSVSNFMLGSLVHLDFRFVQGDKCGSICILHADIQLDQHQLLKMLSFFCHNMVLPSLSKIKCSKVCGFISESLI